MDRLHYILITIGLLCSSGVQANDAFDQGFSAFQAGEYQQALEHFSTAQAAGRTDDELLYNIAICHYRLGQWRDANSLLNELYLKNPELDLVAYNLAVTEKKLGNTERAGGIFLDLELTSTSPEIAELASRQYQLLSSRHTPAQSATGGGRWLASADVNIGIDNNVVDPSDLAVSDTADTFTEALITAQWNSEAGREKNWVVDGYAYLSRYNDVGEYDIAMGEAGIRKYISTVAGPWYLGARAGTSQLGGEGYLQSLSLGLGTAGLFDNGNAWSARYRYREFFSLNEQYDPQAGGSQLAAVDVSGRAGARWNWQLGTRYEFDDREDDLYEGGFSSYSANRYGMGARWGFTDGNWRASVRLDYRRSNFLDDNLLADGSAAKRQDDRYTLTLRGSWAYMSNWAITAEYSYTDNASTIDTYNYDREVMTLGIGRQF